MDSWIGYTTKKTVFIRDRWLGLIYYGLVLCVLLYIFGIQILKHNEQFLLANVQGIPRMKVSHPTVHHCDSTDPDCKSAYRSLQELTYCYDYDGDHPEPHQAHCKFEDATSIMPDGEVDNKMFIPTAVEIVTERRSCKPGPDNGFTCDNEYEEIPGSDCIVKNHMCRSRGGLKDQFYYVADAKNFNIQFTSSYEQGEVHGTSLDHPAYYEICDARVSNASGRRLWADRLQHSEDAEVKCAEADVRLVEFPCQKGVNCRQKEAFDFMHHSGVKSALKKTEKSIDDSIGGLEELERKIRRPRDKGGEGKKATFLQPEAENVQLHVQNSGSTSSSTPQADVKDSLKAFPDPQLPKWLKAHKPPPGEIDQQQWQSAYGDVFTLQRLMELAGSDLDNSYNMDGWTTRESGSVLEVSVVYSNLHPYISTFGYKEVDYYYRVKELPLPYMSRRQLAKVQPPDFPETRRYEIRHGILIWFRVVGQFGNYNNTYFLIYLVTALALIGAANSITDFIAIYIHKRKNNYFNLKYEVSGDFSRMWQCPKCSYWNTDMHDECQQYDMWENSEQSTRCGEPKHSSETKSSRES